MLERHAERDGEATVGPRIDLGHAEVGARRGVGVLAVRGEPVGGPEHLPPGPLTAQPLPLDRARRVRREDHAVVLVGLVDDAARVVLHEVAGQAQVVGGEVGEPVRGHLVGHREQVHQVLDREVPALFRAVEQRRGRGLRHEDGRGEVVHLYPLPQEVGEVAGHLVAEQEVAERLQDDRARRIGADRFLLDVDPVVAQVGQRADRPREILDVADGEAVMAHHRDQHALGQRASGVTDSAQRVGCLTLDDLEVVAPFPHGLTQRRVRGAGLLRRGGRLGLLGSQFGRHRDQMLEHVGGNARADLQLRQAKTPVRGIPLGFGYGDLELRPAAGRLPA